MDKEAHTLEMLSNGTIDGFILSVSEEAQKIGEYNHFQRLLMMYPIVMFRTADGIECDKVIVDDFDSRLKLYAAANRFGMQKHCFTVVRR
jgi:LacI family transcriptional regulator